MKIIIFAGGVGTRLWPLSRKNSPKQFEKIIGDKSTLQQTIDRLSPEFSPKDIYIATGIRYRDIILKQLPNFSEDNLIFEPEMRDVGPAIGLVTLLLSSKFPNEPIAILWSDHMIKNIDAFKHSLFTGQNMIEEGKADFVFLAQKPRFANQNMGWIEIDKTIKEKDGVSVYTFKQLRYRPKIEEAKDFFINENYVWNLGYFITTPIYLESLFQIHAPEMYEKLILIQKSWGTTLFEHAMKEIYPTLEKISFDDLILVKLNPEKIYVVSADLGWSDVGAWEALKEALTNSEDENAIKGNVMLESSKDALVFNYRDQLVVGIDLSQMLVINTEDVLLICPKIAVPKIKKLVESLNGTSHEYLT
ncbi:MAG: sugar phosphate nucleotidyltransferase [Candidatus Levybacteria bacterium]|nr:sugar phosphate nucleotidyltransferase [Candidatus Levybacteria bacterium]MSU25821.1 hypothetical protein [Candidatus Levybacteria bacterium]